MQTIRLFADVAACHSFSEAAALHGITQSAASQRIGQLEKRLGVTLIDRSVRPLTLSEAGRLYLEGITDVLERYDKLEQRISALRSAPAGAVRVAAIYSAGIELLERARQQFEAQQPRVSVRIRYETPDDVYQRVLDHDCDLGILSYPQSWRKVGIIPLRDEAMAVVCSPSHPLAGWARVQAAELVAYPMVTFDTDLPVGRRIRQYLRDHGGLPPIVNSFDNIDTLKSAVSVTERFTVLPKRTVYREMRAGTLRAVELDPALVRPIGIIYRRRPRQGPAFTPAAQSFVDFLLEHAGPSVDMLESLDQAEARSESATPRETLVGAKG